MKELEKRLLAEVEEFIAGEESYGDSALISVDPASGEVHLLSATELLEDSETSEIDYYDVMDLVKMSPDEPGKWIPDAEAITSVAEEY